MMKKRVSVLGSTGSIGTQALHVMEKLGYEATVLTARNNISLLEKQIRKFHPVFAAVTDESAAKELRVRVADTDTQIISGEHCLCECAEVESDILLNAVVGMVGLAPTLAAIEAGKDIALANKETLVAGGALVMSAAARKGIQIYPVDSEHSAIFQSLQGCPDGKMVHRLILTASGGPFFGKTEEELQKVTRADALKHPNWSMGSKITIDSATMMNKGLELIEASWLFQMPPEKIDIVVHRESVIHSLVEYVDHSMIAQLGVPDMAIPIQYALTYPERFPSPAKQLNLTEYGKLTFYAPDDQNFPSMNLCREALKKGGCYPAIVNGANEKAVELFLQDQIKFTDIGILVKAAMEHFGPSNADCLEDILNADRNAREFVVERLTEI